MDDERVPAAGCNARRGGHVAPDTWEQSMKSNDDLVNELRPGPLPATRAVTPEQKREVIERLLAA